MFPTTRVYRKFVKCENEHGSGKAAPIYDPSPESVHLILHVPAPGMKALIEKVLQVVELHFGHEKEMMIPGLRETSTSKFPEVTLESPVREASEHISLLWN